MLIELLLLGGAIAGGYKFATDDDFRAKTMQAADKVAARQSGEIQRDSERLERAHDSGRISDAQYQQARDRLDERQDVIDRYYGSRHG